MNYEEFLEPREPKNNLKQPEAAVNDEALQDSDGAPEELDVQKAVVEELAADKAALDEEVSVRGEQIVDLKGELAKIRSELAEVQDKFNQATLDVSHLQGEIVKLRGELAAAHDAVAAEQAKTARVRDELAAEKEKQFDQQERNPNALALLDRDVELPDRFPGETRDQVLEALAEARDRAEADGRVRRAQILESVLVANEPNGTLAQKREELKKLFAENGNVINGTVIEALKGLGLTHKNGEDYLLVGEILKRAY